MGNIWMINDGFDDYVKNNRDIIKKYILSMLFGNEESTKEWFSSYVDDFLDGKIEDGILNGLCNEFYFTDPRNESFDESITGNHVAIM